MSKAVTVKSDLAALEHVLIKGDLAGFNEKQRLNYVKALCKATGVSILFQPFDYINYQGKLIIYPKRSCTEQLRAIHKINIKIIGRERVDGLYVVTSQGEITTGKMKGKIDEAIGAVNIKGLSGKDLANALMVAETKSKRRLTLSICGLGFLDEIEIQELVKAESRLVSELAVEATTEKLETSPQSPSVDPAEVPSAHGPNYKMKSGRHQGKTLKSIPLRSLTTWWSWYTAQMNEGKQPPADIQADASEVGVFLEVAQFAVPQEEVPNEQL